MQNFVVWLTRVLVQRDISSRCRPQTRLQTFLSGTKNAHFIYFWCFV